MYRKTPDFKGVTRFSRCEYGYSDTWQRRATDPRLLAALREISAAVAATCGLATCLDGDDGAAACAAAAARGHPALNSVNLNYYPRGGGVGWHADDEFLFDALERDAAIVSLSLCDAPASGRRRFEVRLKKAFVGGGGGAARRADADAARRNEESGGAAAARALTLGHGDLMTMEGMHQLFYLHSVWPGDSREHRAHALTQGERINLTWRTIVRHLDGGEECRGMRCPLAASSS